MAAISSLLRIRPTPVMPSDCAICWSSGISSEARPVPARRRFLASGSSSPEVGAASLIRSDVVPVVSLNGFLPWRNFEWDSRSFRVFQIAAMPMFWSASRHRFDRLGPSGRGGWKTTVDTGCNTPGLSAEQTVLIEATPLGL
ncbi:hypothetical protein ACFQS3_05265 [Glycomyces mayteni]|uniref:Uncharacterized protein n=1 Tax=Glycomyces mayteni TaxID=543887 RepID=A0ABW2D2R5_9ACTN